MNLDEVRKHMAMRDRWLLLTEGQRAAANMELADDVPGLVDEVASLRMQVQPLLNVIADLRPRLEAALLQNSEFLTFLHGLKEEFCGWTCPSVWKTADGQPHDQRCKDLRAMLEGKATPTIDEAKMAIASRKARCVEKCNHPAEFVCDYEDGTLHCLECIAEKFWQIEDILSGKHNVHSYWGALETIAHPERYLTKYDPVELAKGALGEKPKPDTCENFKADGGMVVGQFCSQFEAVGPGKHSPTCQFAAKPEEPVFVTVRGMTGCRVCARPPGGAGGCNVCRGH